MAGLLDVLLFVGIIVVVALATSIWFASVMVVFWLGLFVVLYRPEWLRDGVFALSVAAFGVGHFSIGDEQAGMPFYEATVQIVPVVFVALAVEIHTFRSSRPRHAEDLRPAAVIALGLVYAEYESLRVLATGDAVHGELSVIVGALAAAAVGIVLPVLLGRRPDAPSQVRAATPRVTVATTNSEGLGPSAVRGTRGAPRYGLIALVLLVLATWGRRR